MSNTYYLVNMNTGRYLWCGQDSCCDRSKFYLYKERGVEQFLIQSRCQKLRFADSADDEFCGEVPPLDGFYEVEWDGDRFVVASDMVEDYSEFFDRDSEGRWKIKDEYNKALEK